MWKGWALIFCNRALLLGIFMAGWGIACDSWAMLCENYTLSELTGMPQAEIDSYVASCTVKEDELFSAPVKRQVSWKQDSGSDIDFWDNWAGYVDSPLLSSRSDTTFYGLGFWIPEKYQDVDIMTIEDMQKWIKMHGLQMSLGIGGQDGRSARFRFDYRWHDENLNDVLFQVEIPFQ